MVQRCRVAVWRSWGSACCRRSANIGLSKGWSSSQTGHDYEDEQSHGTILTRRKWAKAPMQQAGQLGTEKAGHMRTAKKFHATRNHQRMRRRCCQGSESAYPFQSDAAKRNPKPAQIPPRHCLSSKCSDPQDPALGRGAPRVDCQPQGQRRGQRRGVQPGRQAPRERRPGEHGATVGCGRSPGKGCHRHRFHHLRMGQEPGLQPRRPGLGCRERRQPDSDLGRRAGKDLLRSTSERHALLSNTGFTRSTSTGN